MKHIIAVATLAIAMPTFAINTYRTKDHSCSALKEFLRTEGVVHLKYRLLGGGTHYYRRQDACRGKRDTYRYKWVARGNSIFSGDGKLCFMGYRCYKEERDNDRVRQD